MNFVANCVMPTNDKWIVGFGMRKIRECFAQGLRRQLRLHDLSQKDFAKDFGAAEATVSRWANAEKMPTWPAFDRICTHFEIDPIELLFPESVKTPGPGKVVLDLEQLASQSGYTIKKKDS